MKLLTYIKKYFPEDPQFESQTALKIEKILKEFNLKMIHPNIRQLNYKFGLYDVYIYKNLLVARLPKEVEERRIEIKKIKKHEKHIVQDNFTNVSREYNAHGTYGLLHNQTRTSC